MTEEHHVQATLATALTKTRFKLRGLLCCAGISGGGPSIDFPADRLRQIMDINVTGTFLCAQAVAREIQRHGAAGSIVFVASMSAHGSNKVDFLMVCNPGLNQN